MRRRMRRAPKAQVMWERFSDLNFTAAGSLLASERLYAAPGLVDNPLVPLDENWTLRRMRIDLVYNYAFTVAVPDDMTTLWCCLYRKSINDPTIAAPYGPGAQDILDKWSVQFQPVVAGSLVCSPLGISDGAQRRDVKVMRKLDQDEGIFFSMAIIRLGVPTSTSGFCRAFASVSNLWSRTQRK